MADQAAYRAFCRVAPDLPVFAQDWYLDACAGPDHWAAVLVTDGGRVLAALPYCFRQRGPWRYAVMPVFVKWLGPYLLPEFRGVLKKEHTLMQQLLAQLPDFAVFKQNFYPTVTNWLPFYWQQYQQTTYYTYRLTNLRKLAEVEAGINRNMRRNLHKARQQLRVVHEVPQAAEQLFKMVTLSLERQGTAMPVAWEQFARHEAALGAQQARQLFFAVDEAGRVHAASCLIWDGQTAYYHLAGDDPALRAGGGSILLTWEAIRYASEVLGLECFDFEGSMLPNIEAIRVQFGATQTPYFFVWKHNSRWLRLLEKLRS